MVPSYSRVPDIYMKIEEVVHVIDHFEESLDLSNRPSVHDQEVGYAHFRVFPVIRRFHIVALCDKRLLVAACAFYLSRKKSLFFVRAICLLDPGLRNF